MAKTLYRVGLLWNTLCFCQELHLTESYWVLLNKLALIISGAIL